MSIHGTKEDTGKPRMDLLNPEFLLEMGRVMEFGANVKKYGDRNWEKGIAYGRLFGALMRHALSFWKGEDNDKESSLQTLAHVAVNAMMLASMSSKWDDRPTHSGVYLCVDKEGPEWSYDMPVKYNGKLQ